MQDYILQMKGIKKSFNNTKALKGVDLYVKKGEIHALVGENGAGKSTLMNILGGVLSQDDGEIYFEGKKIQFITPKLASHLGISFIHQELNLINDLKVYENLFLGKEIKNKFGFLKVNEMIKKTKDVLNLLNVDIDAEYYVRDLDISSKQIVEIAKAILYEAKLIIMDEPTTSLTDIEIKNLFKIMIALKNKGVSIIFISHKLKEVFEICDSYTVLKDGLVTGFGDIKCIDENLITKLMVGKEISEKNFFIQGQSMEIVLEVKNLSCKKFYKNINFKLLRGEILGFTGLLGDGRSELFESIFGIKRYNGEIFVKGKLVEITCPQKAFSENIAYIPKNRKENAIIKDMSVIQNITISSLKNIKKGLFINKKLEKQISVNNIKKFNIKVDDINSKIINLSGGNQQKVIIARWLEANAEIIIFDNPTQGIDVGAKAEIYEIIANLARNGKGIIISTPEPQEVLKICDRIFVMYHGEIVGILNRNQANEEIIMKYATGVIRGDDGDK